MATEYNACVDLLDRNVEGGRADHPAVVTRGRSVTYAGLLGEVRATAAGLRRMGVGPEQRVAMVMLDSIEFYDVFLATMRIGAVAAPVNPLLPGRDLGAIVANSRARVLVVSAERAGEVDAIRAAAPEVETVVVTGVARVGLAHQRERRGGRSGRRPRGDLGRVPRVLAVHLRVDGPAQAGHAPPPRPADLGRHLRRRRCWASAPTTAATPSGRCSTPTGSATR